MLAPTPASANAFQTANDTIPVDCSDQIGKFSAYEHMMGIVLEDLLLHRDLRRIK